METKKKTIKPKDTFGAFHFYYCRCPYCGKTNSLIGIVRDVYSKKAGFKELEKEFKDKLTFLKKLPIKDILFFLVSSCEHLESIELPKRFVFEKTEVKDNG